MEESIECRSKSSPTTDTGLDSADFHLDEVKK